MVETLQGKKEDRSETCFITREAKELARLLVDWKVNKVKREGNNVANDLAQLARRNTHTAVWLRQAPMCVTDLLNSECKHISPS